MVAAATVIAMLRSQAADGDRRRPINHQQDLVLKWLVIVVTTSGLHIVGLLLFGHGFLLTRTALADRSTCSDFTPGLIILEQS